VYSCDPARRTLRPLKAANITKNSVLSNGWWEAVGGRQAAESTLVAAISRR
jgi:hypothetical protein